MTLKVKLHFMNSLHIHRNFYQNWFKSECAQKNLAKIPESQNHVFPVFFARCRKTCIIINNDKKGRVPLGLSNTSYLTGLIG